MFQLKSRVLWPPVPASKLSVTLSGAYCRQHVSALYESLLEEEWRERSHQTEGGGRKFNSPLFRLHDTSLPGECEAVQCRSGLTCQCDDHAVLVKECQKVDLKVGLSWSKESVATDAQSVLSANLAYIGYELYKKPQTFLAASITNHVIVLTQDGYIPVVRKLPFDDTKQGSIKRRLTRTGSRSSSISENTSPNGKKSLVAKWSLPNISPDPLETDVQEVKHLVSLHSNSAREEIVGSVKRCLKDIFGVKDITPSQILLFAVLYDKEHNNKPELVYVVRTSLSSAKLSEKCSSKMYDLAFFKGDEKGESVTLYRGGGGNTISQTLGLKMVSEVLRHTITLCRAFDCVDFSLLMQ